MTGEFGDFLRKRRIEKKITLREFAAAIGIAPPYLSDIEKGHRYPPDKDKLYAIAKTLQLSVEDMNLMFDLAGRERANAISPDLPEYIMATDNARVALRLARDASLGESEWQKLVDLIMQEYVPK